MECRKIQEYFSAYLDGELPGAQADLVSRHLEVCPHCRQEYQAWQQLWDALTAELVHAPEDLPPRVLARLPSRSRYWWQSAALAASLLVGIFVGSKLGLDLHQATILENLTTTEVAWEGLEEIPTNSLGAISVSYDLNGNGL